MAIIIRLQIANLIYYFVSFFFFFGNARQVTKAHTCPGRKVGNYVGVRNRFLPFVRLDFIDHVLPFVWCRKPVALRSALEALLMTLDVCVSPTLGIIRSVLFLGSGS